MGEQTAERPRGPRSTRWTHVALPCVDIDATIAWYERYTPLRLLVRRVQEGGIGAWMGHPEPAVDPFILVLSSTFRDQERGEPIPILAPFAHLGFETPDAAEVDRAAAAGSRDGCLVWSPRQMPPPIGYVAALRDPDGNVVEFSYGQSVYETAREVWGE